MTQMGYALRLMLLAGMFNCMGLSVGSAFQETAGTAGFRLVSPDISPGSSIGLDYVFDRFGCKGKNLSPALSWTEPPPGTKSFLVTVFDPDANAGSGWWHWIVTGIPADSRALVRGAGSAAGTQLPRGAAQSGTDFGQKAYGGPCPPVGDAPHHYVFTVYAMAVDKVDAPDSRVGFTPTSAVLGKASFTALYGRARHSS